MSERAPFDPEQATYQAAKFADTHDGDDTLPMHEAVNHIGHLLQVISLLKAQLAAAQNDIENLLDRS